MPNLYPLCWLSIVYMDGPCALFVPVVAVLACLNQGRPLLFAHSHGPIRIDTVTSEKRLFPADGTLLFIA